MYKQFSNDEIVTTFVFMTAALVNEILDNFNIHIMSAEAGMVFLMVFFAYLFFSRPIKFLINLLKNRKLYYTTFAFVDAIEYFSCGDGGYKYYILKYIDENFDTHKVEVHASFTVFRWKIKDKIKIMALRHDPDNIIVVYSDTALAVFMTLIGIILETIIIAVFISTH